MFALRFNDLQRHGELRNDKDFIANSLADSNTLLAPVYKQQIAIEGEKASWLSKSALEGLFGEISHHHLIYLGELSNRHYFAYRLSSLALLETVSSTTSDLRSMLHMLSPDQAYLINIAIALNHWHSSHQYCGYCGAKTYAKQAGYARECSLNSCRTNQFPRTDPAIIVAITHSFANGEEKILLGRQSNWPEKRYSIIAGFVEPGETLEQAVSREAEEEVGISITNINYAHSQPWPFPQSVMLGFTAESTSTDITLKDGELETADWFSRSQIATLLEKDELKLPFKFSISRALINDWLTR